MRKHFFILSIFLLSLVLHANPMDDGKLIGSDFTLDKLQKGDIISLASPSGEVAALPYENGGIFDREDSPQPHVQLTEAAAKAMGDKKSIAPFASGKASELLTVKYVETKKVILKSASGEEFEGYYAVIHVTDPNGVIESISQEIFSADGLKSISPVGLNDPTDGIGEFASVSVYAKSAPAPLTFDELVAKTKASSMEQAKDDTHHVEQK